MSDTPSAAVPPLSRGTWAEDGDATERRVSATEGGVGLSEAHTRPASTAVASSLAALALAPAPTRNDGPIVSFGPPQVSGGLLGDLEPTIRRMRAGIRACFERFVESEDDAPDASSMSLRFVVMPNGSVQSVRTEGAAGVAPAVGDCIARRVQMTTFPLPTGQAAVVVLPLELRP